MTTEVRLKALLELKEIRNKVKELEISQQPIKLHLACGKNYKDDWINIDNNSDDNITKLDLIWDLRYSLPFDDNSVDFIYNEHFLEHLTVAEAERSLKDFLRILKPSGVMRIAMPNLQGSINIYTNQNWKEDYKDFLNQPDFSRIKTKAEFLNVVFRSWGHQWLYDWEELERRLLDVGGKNIIQAKIFKSEHAELCNLETRQESTLVAEVQKSLPY